MPGSAVLSIADTYVEQGVESTWDHGGCTWADIDTKPAGITYLKFNLTGRTAPITKATLTLHCLNASLMGGTIYAVGASTWVEGTGCGAGGAGLKWTDVDTNRDGKIDSQDQSPYVPGTVAVATLGAVAAGHDVILDVTSAFRAGAGVYTLAIRSTSSDGATYATRENPTAAWRPRLDLR